MIYLLCWHLGGGNLSLNWVFSPSKDLLSFYVRNKQKYISAEIQ